jgi:1-acyl-sn-glycerol-3-phosphate acyltransferase
MFVSILIYTQFVLWTILYTILCSPFFAVSVTFAQIFRRDKVQRIVRYFIIWYGKCIIRIALFPYVRMSYRHKTDEPIVGGIYVFNHRSGSDPFFAGCATFRPIVQIVNDWPMRLPFLGYFARFGGYIDVKNESYEWVKEYVTKLVAEGTPVIAFPEGTRSGNRSMNQFYSTVFHIAKEIDCPIIPMVIAGNENIPNRSFRMKPGRVLMHRLPAIPQDLIRNSSALKIKKTVHTIIFEESQRMDQELDMMRQGGKNV